MAHGHGGARAGAGRRKGTMNKKDRLKSGELMPVDFMLAVMRNPKNDYSRRMDAAKSVAPYIHPKLVAAQIETNDTDRAMILQTLVERAQVDREQPKLIEADAKELPNVQIQSDE